MDHALAKSIFSTLYEDVRGYELSFSARKKLDYHDRGHTYGEIIFDEFQALLKDLHPQDGEVFYDLGSGTGKAVIAAALLFPFKKVVGVELLDELCFASVHVLERLKAEGASHSFELPEIQFYQKDFLKFDFSDADVVFAHATCFHDGQLRLLQPQLEKLKKGSRLLVVSKPIGSPIYKLVGTSERPFSWGKATLHSYLKVV